MSPADLVAHFKTIAATARAFQVSSASISQWISDGEVPIARQCQAELLTSGALKADRDEDGNPVKRDARAAPSQEAAAQ